MESAATMAAPAPPKRPGSPLAEQSMPTAKNPRLGSSQLQINYLVRQKQDILPLVTVDERMPRILHLMGEYDGVLQRHESMAGNLGACPLGPILLKRFERLFEGPPRVLKSHAKDPSITWLDVVEFAAHRPEQFNLEKQRNGVRVCQFYHKQCRVEISEEDYVLIASGMPQKLIPPQPILEDEEKELGVMEILERNLGKVVQMADQVSARARQLNHKIKNRRAAIMARRETEPETQQLVRMKDPSASPQDIPANLTIPAHSIETSQSPPMGFTAVNNRQSLMAGADSRISEALKDVVAGAAGGSAPGGVGGVNGGVRADILSKFLTESERQAGMTEDTIRRASLPPLNRDALRQSTGRTRQDSTVYPSPRDKISPSVAIPSTPASLLPHVKAITTPKDDGGPYKAEMIARMETMARGERVIPPCDRCRRLQMDCMKNLTACQGCTKKHAKCSWKEVSREELESAPPVGNQLPAEETHESSAKDWDRLLKGKPDDVDGERGSSAGGGGGGGGVDTTEATDSSRKSLPLSNTTQPSPKLDLRPPPLDSSRESANGKHKKQGQYSAVTSPHSTVRPQRMSAAHDVIEGREEEEEEEEDDEEEGREDEGDRLANLARQVYRSASQNVRPPEA